MSFLIENKKQVLGRQTNVSDRKQKNRSEAKSESTSYSVLDEFFSD
jgi:hypothetical protein